MQVLDAQFGRNENQMSIVDVIIGTYNHERFIAQAIESVLMQKTDFDVQIHIADDCSTDKTQDIIMSYYLKYSDKIDIVLDTKNRGLQSKDRKFLQLLRESKARYIALLEGDDYWTDHYKLQKQVNFLEENPEYVICYHDAFVVDSSGKFIKDSLLPDDMKRDFSDEELRRTAWVSTLSMCFKNVIQDFPEEFYKVYSVDKFLTCLLGCYGKGKFIESVEPAAYRIHSEGSFSSLSNNKKYFFLTETYAWLCRYYRRTNRIEDAECLKRIFISRLETILEYSSLEPSEEHADIISQLFTNYTDILDDNNAVRLKTAFMNKNQFLQKL
jgi:glycosyltransferase involved in cell wall biosynthesis